MKLLRRLTMKQLWERERAPWGWGRAYAEFSADRIVIAPIPLNWIIGWLREVYFRFAHGPRDEIASRIHTATNKGFAEGYKYGYSQGVRHMAILWKEAPKS